MGVEDIKDGFDLYDRTGEGKLFYNQVGDLIRGLGFKPTNKDVAGVLGNPKKEEMNTKTCNFDEFLGYVKSIAETQQEGTFEVSVSSTRKVTVPSWALKSDTFWPPSVKN